MNRNLKPKFWQVPGTWGKLLMSQSACKPVHGLWTITFSRKWYLPSWSHWDTHNHTLSYQLIHMPEIWPHYPSRREGQYAAIWKLLCNGLCKMLRRLKVGLLKWHLDCYCMFMWLQPANRKWRILTERIFNIRCSGFILVGKVLLTVQWFMHILRKSCRSMSWLCYTQFK